MVRKSSPSQNSADGAASKYIDIHRDADVDGDMIVGDLDPEIVESGAPSKIRQDRGSIKIDAEDIMNGMVCIIVVAMLF